MIYNENPWINRLWRMRKRSEVIFYWIMAFYPVVGLIVLLVTKDFWKMIGAIGIGLGYNLIQNLRGLGLHVEFFIEEILGKKFEW